MQGKFVTIEGIDGAGKSSVTAALEEFLKQEGIEVYVTREPGGTELAEELRDATLRHRSETVLPITEVLMLFAGRAQHLNEKIKPSLARGEWVLSDRFTDSTIAYQGGGHQLDRQFLFNLANHVHKDCWPTRTYLLDVPVEVGLERKTGTQPDRIEIQDAAFYERTRAMYLYLAKQYDRIVLIDSTLSIDEVFDQICLDLRTSLLP